MFIIQINNFDLTMNEAMVIFCFNIKTMLLFCQFFFKNFFYYIEYYSSINSCPCYQLTLFKNDWIENGTEPLSHFQNSNTWEFLLHVCIIQNVYRMLLFEILKNARHLMSVVIDLIMEESWWRMEGFGVLSFEIMWKLYNRKNS